MKAARGFTLIEAMLGLLISGLMVTSILAAMRAQMVASYQQGRIGETQQMARTAMENLSSAISMTGFGIPGKFAFTHGAISRAADNAAGGDTFQTCPGTDVIEIRQRDPRAFWGLANATSSALTLQAFQVDGVAIAASQDIAWPVGTWLFAFAPAPATPLLLHTGGRAKNTLAAAVLPADTLPTANAIPTAGADAELDVVKVIRFRVACVDAAHPVLQYEEDADLNGDGVVDTQDFIPVASDIEDLQLAYFIDQDEDGLVADADAVALPAESATKAAQLARVKAMRVTIVARSSEQQQDGMSDVPPSIENHNRSSEPEDHYLRRVLRDTLLLNNRDTRRPDTYAHVSNYWM